MSGVEEWQPAFEGQRRPFTPGHTLSMKSGWRSPRAVGPVAEALLEAILEDDSVAYLRQPRFRPALVAWAQVEARVALFEKYVDEMTMEQRLDSGNGRTSPEEQLRKLDANALTHRGRLGLDPLSAARLGKDIAQGRAADTATIMAALHNAEGAGGTAPGSRS